MKYNGIVLYSDLDGTLLDKERQLSRENMEAISHFVNEGGLFGVATGRMEKSVGLNFPDLPINTPSIFFNGALIFDTRIKKDLHSVYTPEGLGPIFQGILDKHSSAGVEINAAGKAYILRYNDIIRTQVAREGLIDVETGWDGIPDGWYKILVADTHENLEVIKAEIDGHQRNDIQVMFSEHELLDIVAQGVSKGKALRYLQSISKESWHKLFAVGDNDNDLEMIQMADVGIAVANARLKVKEAAKFEIAHHDTPCIPQILRIIDEYI